MAKYNGPVCRLCRREGEKLFLKGERCYTNKCAMEKRGNPPGVHWRSRGRYSEYKMQLREKQKVKRIYGILERQFRKIFKTADSKKGVTGTNLLVSLEARLDNIVYRGGFVGSRSEARQLVRHGHFAVNGQRVNIPSFQVKPSDVISVIDSSKSIQRIANSLQGSEARKIPEWLALDRSNFRLEVRAMPSKAQVSHPVNEQLIVELYSK